MIAAVTRRVCSTSAHEAIKTHRDIFMRNTANHRPCTWSGFLYYECTVNGCGSTLMIPLATWNRWHERRAMDHFDDLNTQGYTDAQLEALNERADFLCKQRANELGVLIDDYVAGDEWSDDYRRLCERVQADYDTEESGS